MEGYSPAPPPRTGVSKTLRMKHRLLETMAASSIHIRDWATTPANNGHSDRAMTSWHVTRGLFPFQSAGIVAAIVRAAPVPGLHNGDNGPRETGFQICNCFSCFSSLCHIPNIMSFLHTLLTCLCMFMLVYTC